MALFNFLVAQAEELKNQPQIHPPLLTGNDLMELGVQPGRELGGLLHEIRERQLADELKTPDEARAWVKQMLATAVLVSEKSPVNSDEVRRARQRSTAGDRQCRDG